MFILGMPNPILWGVMAGLLNFIPYVGALIGIAIVTFVALVSFAELGQVLLVPTVYFSLNVLEAYLITPLALSQRLTLNPVILFVWVIFWGWIWGIGGAILAVPMF